MRSLQRFSSRLILALLTAFQVVAQTKLPHPMKDGFALPNGWQITPIGHSVPTEDMVLKLIDSPDDRVI
jgi:hypothetical protein